MGDHLEITSTELAITLTEGALTTWICKEEELLAHSDIEITLINGVPEIVLEPQASTTGTKKTSMMIFLAQMTIHIPNQDVLEVVKINLASVPHAGIPDLVDKVPTLTARMEDLEVA